MWLYLRWYIWTYLYVQGQDFVTSSAGYFCNWQNKLKLPREAVFLGAGCSRYIVKSLGMYRTGRTEYKNSNSVCEIGNAVYIIRLQVFLLVLGVNVLDWKNQCWLLCFCWPVIQFSNGIVRLICSISFPSSKQTSLSELKLRLGFSKELKGVKSPVLWISMGCVYLTPLCFFALYRMAPYHLCVSLVLG